MILGLSLAQSAAELAGSGIVHMDTDLSTGGQANANDQIMIAFLRQLDNSHTVLTELLIPGLYSSQHNVVAHDYITLKNKYFLEFDFDRLNWLLHIAGDLNMPDRIWSSPEVEHEQKTLFHKFIHQQLTPLQKIKLRRGLISRNIQKLRHQAFRRCISILKPIVLRLFQNSISSFKPHPRYCSEVDDILNFHESS